MAGASGFDDLRHSVAALELRTRSVAIIVFISAARDIPTIIFLSTHETRTLSLLMLDYIAEANQEKAAVLGVFLVFLIFCFRRHRMALGISQAIHVLIATRRLNSIDDCELPDVSFVLVTHRWLAGSIFRPQKTTLDPELTHANL